MLVKDKKIKIVLDNDINKPYNVLNKQSRGGEEDEKRPADYCDLAGDSNNLFYSNHGCPSQLSDASSASGTDTADSGAAFELVAYSE